MSQTYSRFEIKETGHFSGQMVNCFQSYIPAYTPAGLTGYAINYSLHILQIQIEFWFNIQEHF